MIPAGVIPPLLTPLHPDRTPDTDALGRLVDRLIGGGVHALFAAGTAGLGSVLTDAQYEAVVAVAASRAAGRRPVLAGLLEPSTARNLERLRKVEKTGIAGVVAVAPYYCRAQNDTQLLRHFGLLRETTGLDFAIYNIPSCVGCEIPVPLIADMAARGWLSAVKDSSGNPDYFRALCRCGVEHGFHVYQGLHPDFAQLKEWGASGCVPVPGNVYPERFAAAWEHRDSAELPKFQKACDEAWDELFVPGDFFRRSMRHLAREGIGADVMPEPF